MRRPLRLFLERAHDQLFYDLVVELPGSPGAFEIDQPVQAPLCEPLSPGAYRVGVDPQERSDLLVEQTVAAQEDDPCSRRELLADRATAHVPLKLRTLLLREHDRGRGPAAPRRITQPTHSPLRVPAAPHPRGQDLDLLAPRDLRVRQALSSHQDDARPLCEPRVVAMGKHLQLVQLQWRELDGDGLGAGHRDLL